MASCGNRPVSGLTSGTIAGGVLLLAGNSNIADERVFTLGAGLTGVDGGANGAYTMTNDLLTGKAGGQTVTGGTGSADNLTLSSTSNATKGKIRFATSAINETTGYVGIGTQSPSYLLHVQSNLAGASAASKFVVGNASTVGAAGFEVFAGGDLAIESYGSAYSGSAFGNSFANANLIHTWAGSLIIGTETAAPVVIGTNTAERFRINPTAVATSGTDRSFLLTGHSFAPTSGTAAFRALELNYTVNQTGGANGAVTGILVNTTETALIGTHNLLDLQNGGVSKFKVNSLGYVTCAAGVNLTVSNVYATSTQALFLCGSSSNAAAARPVKFANIAGLTTGNDRFLTTWYNDNVFASVAAEVTGAGSLALGGAGSYTDVAGPCLFLKNVTTAHTTAPSGGSVMYSGVNSGFRFKTADFVQSSGASAFNGSTLEYTINQTSTATGAVTGLLVNATETAVLGTHKLLDLQVGGTSKLSISNAGALLSGAGSVSAPGVAVGLANHGLHTSYGTGVLAVTVAGTERARFVHGGGMNVAGYVTTSLIQGGDNTGGAVTSGLQINAPSSTNALGLFITSTAARTLTSGTQRGIVVDFSSSAVGGFAPTSGTATFRAFEIGYGINQTGGANGTVTGILVNATETAVIGTHNLIDLQVGGFSKFSVRSNGNVNAALYVTALGFNGGFLTSATVNTSVKVNANWTDAATRPGVQIGSEYSLTSGNDRNVSSWYRDNLTTKVAEMTSAGSLALGGAGSFTNMVGAGLFLKDVTTAPTTNPTGGIVLFSDGGVLKCMFPSGAIKTVTVT